MKVGVNFFLTLVIFTSSIESSMFLMALEWCILSRRFPIAFALIYQRNYYLQQLSVQFSCSVVSDSLRPHESQQTRPPCPSPTPGVHPNSCPSAADAIQPSHPLLSPFFSCPQYLPVSGSFPMNQLFTWGGQSTGVSASASVLPMNTQDWSPLDELVGSPCSPGNSQELSPTSQFKGSIL